MKQSKERISYNFIRINDTVYVLKVHSTVRGRICGAEYRKGCDKPTDYKELPLYNKGNKLYVSIEDTPIYLKKRKKRA